MASNVPPTPAKKISWAPRMWQGCSFSGWLRLLWLHGSRVHLRLLYIAVIDTIVSISNSFLGLIQGLLFGRAVRRTPLVAPPIFILGHWRTGTTLLHDLMICDERFGYPNTYQCLSPCHFLITEWLWVPIFKFLIPSHRPMDNVRMGFDRPQEDEFAMVLLTGNASTYATFAFPNQPPRAEQYLDLTNLPPSALKRWKYYFERFLLQVNYKVRKRLVLKSPPHTARIAVLKEMYPDALFVHIVRDPYVVYPSTVNLWRAMYKMHGLQIPTFEGLEEYVLATHERMYRRLEEGKKMLAPGHFHELKYEDLVRDPLGEIRKIYDTLHLDGFNLVQPRLQAYLDELKGYETNKYQLTDEERATVTKRWGEVIRRYGYGN